MVAIFMHAIGVLAVLSILTGLCALFIQSESASEKLKVITFTGMGIASALSFISIICMYFGSANVV